MADVITWFKKWYFLQRCIIVNFKNRELTADNKFRTLVRRIVYEMIVVVITGKEVIENISFLGLPADYSSVWGDTLKTLIGGFLNVARSPTYPCDYRLDQVLVSWYWTLMVLLEHFLNLRLKYSVSFERRMHMNSSISITRCNVVPIRTKSCSKNILDGIFQCIFMSQTCSHCFQARR